MSSPVRVDEGMPPAFSLHRGMDAQIAAAGDHVIAAWTTAGTDQWGSGPIATALSADGGKSWRPGPNPADDGSTTGHGFIDLAADRSGTFHLTWLDSRDGKQGLRYARSTDQGKSWSRNTTVKSATCECCSNAITAQPDGTVDILFRDGDPRDMTVSISRDGGARWLAPQRAGNFDWKFNGCPHVGGGIVFSQTALHALVWSGKADKTGVHFLSSADLGVSWTKPQRLGSTSGSHPDLAAADQRLAAVWDEPGTEGSAIWGAVSLDGGVSWNAAAKLSKGNVRATHPRVVSTTGGFRVFWTEDRDQPVSWASSALPSG